MEESETVVSARKVGFPVIGLRFELSYMDVFKKGAKKFGKDKKTLGEIQRCMQTSARNFQQHNNWRRVPFTFSLEQRHYEYFISFAYFSTRCTRRRIDIINFGRIRFFQV